MKKVRRSFHSPLQGDHDYANSPRILDEKVLNDLVQRLRDGDLSVKTEIINGHMRLAMSIVAEFATPHRADDLVGEALLGLTQAVVWSGPHADPGNPDTILPSRLHDNNITPYIATTIRRYIRDFISTDRAVFMPGRTFRKKVADGEIDPNGDNSNPVLIAVVSIRLLVLEDDPRATFADNVEARTVPTIPFTIPSARPEEPSVEFTDALQAAICTEDEKNVIERRKQGYKYREISEQIGLSIPRIGQINSTVEERFNKLYA